MPLTSQIRSFSGLLLHHFRRGLLRYDIQHTSVLPLAGMNLYRYLLRCVVCGPAAIGLCLICHERQPVLSAPHGASLRMYQAPTYWKNLIT